MNTQEEEYLILMNLCLNEFNHGTNKTKTNPFIELGNNSDIEETNKIKRKHKLWGVQERTCPILGY